MAVNKVVYDGATLVDLTGDTVTADNLAAGVKATGADGKPIVGLLPKVTIDAELSSTSENPVQNKAIATALDNKHDKNANILVGATEGRRLGFDNKNYLQCSQTGIDQAPVAMHLISNGRDKGTLVGESDLTHSYYKFTGTNGQDDGQAGLVPAPTARDKNRFLKGDGTWAKIPKNDITATDNTWTGQQTFNEVVLNREKYTTYVIIGISDTPVISTMVYIVTGAFTLDLATLAGALSASQSSVFTAYFAANADYSLTISNAGKLKYTGSASDVAITSAGLLLNVWMSKDDDGALTSIIQASKLEGEVKVEDGSKFWTYSEANNKTISFTVPPGVNRIKVKADIDGTDALPDASNYADIKNTSTNKIWGRGWCSSGPDGVVEDEENIDSIVGVTPNKTYTLLFDCFTTSGVTFSWGKAINAMTPTVEDY